MNRRDTIKSILLGSIASGIVLNGCTTEETLKERGQLPETTSAPLYGRTDAEKIRDEKILESDFFNEHELSTIATLCDVILPKTTVYGSATDAEVDQFIAFIVKDIIKLQIPLRGGLMWLDGYSNKLYNKEFINCSEDEQFFICDEIAFPKKTKPELKPGEALFTTIRNLTLTGYFTSKVGIEDLGYKGNIPNVWDGVPEDILKAHGFEYEESWLAKCVNQEGRGDIAKWDEEGNLIS